MINVNIENKNNEKFMTFYSQNNKIGYCIISDDNYVEWFETLIEGAGYSRKMLNELKKIGYETLEGHALEDQQKNFWGYLGAEFSIGSYFEIAL